MAYIRVDASPNEVPTRTMMHDRYARGQTDRGRVSQYLYIRYMAPVRIRDGWGLKPFAQVNFPSLLDQSLEAPDGVDELLDHVEHHRARRPDPIE